MIKAVIFDMDGTLTDTENLNFQILEEILKEKGFNLTKEVFLKTVGVSDKEGGEMLSQAYPGFRGYEDGIQQLGKHYSVAVKEGRLKIKKGVYEILEAIKKRSLPYCIASSNVPELVDLTLNGSNLKQYFDTIICDKDVEHVKPYPDLFIKAAEVMGVKPEECLVIEDSKSGVIAAQKAGTPVIIVPDVCPITDEMKKISVAVVDSLIDVIDYLDKEF